METVYCILDSIDGVSHIRKVFLSYDSAIDYIERTINRDINNGCALLESMGYEEYGDKYAYAKIYTPNRKIRWIELFKREVE